MPHTVKVAFVHDWLTGMRGGERVLEAMLEIFPDAPIYSLIAFPEKLSPALQKRDIRTSWLQKIPGIEKTYRHFLPLMPFAATSWNLSEFDLILSSSHCVAKGVRHRPDAIHVSYIHAPMRYMWSRFDEYFGKGRASWWVRLAARMLRPFFQSWDRATATPEKVDRLIANSHYIATQIQEHYHRKSDVVFPFGELSRFQKIPRNRKDFYLVAGAFAPYKRVDLAIEACERMGRRLIVAGAGQEEENLRKKKYVWVEFLNRPSDRELDQLYSECRALLYPGVEDFGIVPLEVMASGAPVIALAQGGALDTVTSTTGVWIRESSVDGIELAISEFESRESSFDEKALRTQASQFTRERFQKEWKKSVQTAWEARGRAAQELPWIS